MGAVVLAVLSSLFYGASDFLGALSSRTLTVLKASAAIYVAATAAAALALGLTPWNFSEHALWAGTIAGLFAVVGMVTFYAALAIGPMSLLAPLIALIQTAIPVAVATLTGQQLGVVAWIAIALALIATTLISLPARSSGSTEPPARAHLTLAGIALAVLAGVTLGFAVVSLDAAPDDSGVFPAFLDVAVGLVVLAPLLAVRRWRAGARWLGETAAPAAPRASVRTWLMAIVGGVLLGVGNVLLVIALHEGNLAVVAVLVSLYPVATVVLAWLVLKERLSLAQGFGVLLAIVAAALLGSA